MNDGFSDGKTAAALIKMKIRHVIYWNHIIYLLPTKDIVRYLEHNTHSAGGASPSAGGGASPSAAAGGASAGGASAGGAAAAASDMAI